MSFEVDSEINKDVYEIYFITSSEYWEDEFGVSREKAFKIFDKNESY